MRTSIRIAIATLLLLSGCSNNQAATPNQEAQTAIQSLQWLDSADPQHDALQARQKQQHILYQTNARSRQLPGIPLEQQAQALRNCTAQALPGSTDMVLNDTHLDYLNRARNYAEAFNAAMLSSCTQAQ